MKKSIGIIVVIIIIVFTGVYLYNKKARQESTITTAPTLIPTVTSNAYCSTKDLQTTISFDPGAGNMNGTVIIKNISGGQCSIIGDNSISAQYNKQTIKNISIKQNGTSDTKLFKLSPNQSVYAKVHYPNGPQCQGPTVLQNITFTYAISPTDTITFADQKGVQKQVIQVCPTPSEITTIDLWPLTTQPIH